MASSGGSGIVAPRHPVASMRAAFEESVAEADGGPGSNGNSSSTLSTGTGAQIAFGLYLLHDGLAKSDGAVVRILQGHINDMDQFLSNTTTMLDASTEDITRRLQNLQVPLDEFGGISDAFDKMLESREFRKEILERNERVETVERQTTAALQTTIRDLREGLVAVDELAKYLLDLKEGWRKLNLVRVYAAMTHNCELWFRCCLGLQLKAARLAEKLSQLQAVGGEIEKRVASAARRMPVKVPLQPPTTLNLHPQPLHQIFSKVHEVLTPITQDSSRLINTHNPHLRTPQPPPFSRPKAAR
ncbi:hypothetical protein FPQ18DRAFT_33500 [Pyronema domesticum]|nr:hypothetical protein FPQ18DRAFT_33500 [Pyronema domesticum]